MATKPQAKTAIDNVVTLIKADIDNKLPVGVNIRTGSIGFSPNTWTFVLDAGGSLATATSWRDTILANYGLPSSNAVFSRRAEDGEPEKAIVITASQVTIKIVNFSLQ